MFKVTIAYTDGNSRVLKFVTFKDAANWVKQYGMTEVVSITLTHWE